MKDYREEYVVVLKKVEKLIEKQKIDEVISIYENFISNHIYEIIQSQASFASEIYYDYAVFNFNLGNYESFLDLLFQAQQHGYSMDLVKDALIEAFFLPNVTEFKENYNENIKLFKPFIKVDSIEAFEKLKYRLLPFEENRFYIVDISNWNLVSKIDFSDSGLENQFNSIKFNDFFDYTMFSSGQLDQVIYFAEYCSSKNKIGYIVIDNWDLFLATLQGRKIEKNLQSIILFNSVEEFQQYILNDALYLPFNVINLSDNYNYPKAFIRKIHEKRLKRRKASRKPLLSICIPTFNRGHRAYQTVKDLLSFEYGEEIEIVVSNNGTKNETSYFYEKLEKNKDMRLKYFSFTENMGFTTNMCKVAELASADLVLYLSDEDTVDEYILGEILNFIKSNNRISLIKVSILNYLQLSDLYSKHAPEALLQNMLSSNYISGLIMNKKILHQKDAFNKVLMNQDNPVYYAYPHMYWELLLCDEGEVYSTSLKLVKQGSPEKLDGNGSHDFITYNNVVIPHYATIENRLRQHDSFYGIFKQIKAIDGNFDLYRSMYLNLVAKTLFLCEINIKSHYSKFSSKEFCRERFLKAYNHCISTQFFIGSNEQNVDDLTKINNHVLTQYEDFIKRDDLKMDINVKQKE